jgi:acetylglutamate kinase
MTKKPTAKAKAPAASQQDLDYFLRKAKTLSEALPYMRAYAGKTFVIKYGGHAMGDDELAKLFARDVVLFKQVGINPIVVHGGGPQIGAMLERLKIRSEFIDGLRVTDKATVEVVEMVLSGSINKQIVSAINEAGGNAIGLSGRDGNLIEARKLTRKKRDPDSNIEKVVDLGFVGDPHKINVGVLMELARSNVIPVIAPLGAGPDGTIFNINADTAAGAIAGAVGAERLLLLTDVAGAQVRARMKDGTISGGMIPKVETCLDAVKDGVDASVILDGRVPHALILEIFTEHGVGTLIRGAQPKSKKKG